MLGAVPRSGCEMSGRAESALGRHMKCRLLEERTQGCLASVWHVNIPFGVRGDLELTASGLSGRVLSN